MDSLSKPHFILAVLVATFIAFNCPGQQEDMESQPITDTEPEAALPAFPYFAEIVGDNVYIRSGPGTNYYRCGKLGQGDIIKIVSASNVWSRILPPPGSFSWISKQYVTIDAANPDTGTVAGDEVRVYAGSAYYEPIHSDRIQVHLNRGDKVALLGEEMGDYYKIVPPNGAFFWVSTQYTKPADAKAVSAELQPLPQPPSAPAPAPVSVPEPMLTSPEVVPTTLPADSERLRRYYDAQELVKTEFKKALGEQNYSGAKKILNDLLTADDSDKASRYAKFALGQIQRYELAAAVAKEVELQDTELTRICQRIDEAQNEKLADFQDLGQFAGIGTFQTSNVYGPEEILLHYILVDSKGKVICYALPTDSAEKTDLSEFVGKKVGLVGRIEPHPQTAGALVKFTQIRPLM